MTITEQQLHEWALIGARVEVERIFTAFPELRAEYATPLHHSNGSNGAVALHTDLVKRVATAYRTGYDKGAKRVHWTQTPAGRKRWAAIQRKGAHANKRKGAAR